MEAIAAKIQAQHKIIEYHLKSDCKVKMVHYVIKLFGVSVFFFYLKGCVYLCIPLSFPGMFLVNKIINYALLN